MGHATEANERLEILRDELRSVVADDAWRFSGKLFSRPLNDRFDVLLGHAFADLPGYDEAAIAVQKRAEVVKRAAQIEVSYINMPILVRREQLYETGPLFRGLLPFTVESVRFF